MDNQDCATGNTALPLGGVSGRVPLKLDIPKPHENKIQSIDSEAGLFREPKMFRESGPLFPRKALVFRRDEHEQRMFLYSEKRRSPEQAKQADVHEEHN